jgi:hypothetical protein
MGDWRIAATDAFNKRELKRLGEARERERYRAKTLKRLLKGVGIEVDPHSSEAIVDGITFTFVNDQFGYDYFMTDGFGDDVLIMLGQCPKCGCPVYSEFIRDIADLGALLLEFRPHHTHRCI